MSKRIFNEAIRMDHSNRQDRAEPSFWKSRAGIALIMLAAIGAFAVAREHFDHLWVALPYLILLLCPLMHLFHHHGGHSHSHSGDAETSTDDDRK